MGSSVVIRAAAAGAGLPRRRRLASPVRATHDDEVRVTIDVTGVPAPLWPGYRGFTAPVDRHPRRRGLDAVVAFFDGTSRARSSCTRRAPHGTLLLQTREECEFSTSRLPQSASEKLAHATPRLAAPGTRRMPPWRRGRGGSRPPTCCRCAKPAGGAVRGRDPSTGLGCLGRGTLFFLLSGYLLCDYFWRPKAQRRCASSGSAGSSAWPRRTTSRSCCCSSSSPPPPCCSAEQGAQAVLTQCTFTHYYTPDTASSLERQRRPVDAQHRMTLYLTMPLLALFVGWPAARGRRALLWPMVAVAPSSGSGSSTACSSPTRAVALQDFYFGDTRPGRGGQRAALPRPAVPGLDRAVRSRHRAALAGHPALTSRRGSSARRGTGSGSSCSCSSQPGLAQADRPRVHFTHPFLFATFDVVLGVLLLPALLYAARPSSATEGRRTHPRRRLAGWIQLRALPVALPGDPRRLRARHGSAAARHQARAVPATADLGPRRWASRCSATASSSTPARDYGRGLSRRIANAGLAPTRPPPSCHDERPGHRTTAVPPQTTAAAPHVRRSVPAGRQGDKSSWSLPPDASARKRPPDAARPAHRRGPYTLVECDAGEMLVRPGGRGHPAVRRAGRHLGGRRGPAAASPSPPGMRFLDVGANIGYFSALHLQAPPGTTIDAVEPEPGNARCSA